MTVCFNTQHSLNGNPGIKEEHHAINVENNHATQIQRRSETWSTLMLSKIFGSHQEILIQ